MNDHRAVHVRVANHDDLSDVCRLAHDAYVTEGYCAPQPGGRISHYELLDGIPETTVYMAERYDPDGADRFLVGTVSFTIDSAAGLHTDSAFRVETDIERGHCALADLTLAASWRIVTDPDCEARLDVLKALVAQGLIHLEAVGADVLLCTFNPRHARAWTRLLGMVIVSGPRPDSAVAKAPAVLMRGVVVEMCARFRRSEGARR